MRDVMVFSNGHGEDEIAGLILGRLIRTTDERARVSAWPMVGDGTRFARDRISRFGPRNRLPSEGFGTVSLGAFRDDLRAGFLSTYRAQARFARALKGRRAVCLAIGDIVPLTAAWLAGLTTLFYSSAKSAHYGGFDGHNALERAVMRRTARVFVRDERTAARLSRRGIDATCAGNPMMDGLAPAAPEDLRAPDRTNIALLPGTRGDALANAMLLLAATGGIGTAHGILAPAPGFDLAGLAAALPSGWSVAAERARRLDLAHGSGASVTVVPGRFADALAAADLAAGMAGTGNEQAVGLGLPLVAIPGAGNQGQAFHRMKARYFGAAARSVPPKAHAIAAALSDLARDEAARTAMAAAGRALMGPPGASDRLAAELRALAGWADADG